LACYFLALSRLERLLQQKKNYAHDNDSLVDFAAFGNNAICDILLVASYDLEVYYLWRYDFFRYS
jgi:hypothetical protein